MCKGRGARLVSRVLSVCIERARRATAPRTVSFKCLSPSPPTPLPSTTSSLVHVPPQPSPLAGPASSAWSSKSPTRSHASSIRTLLACFTAFVIGSGFIPHALFALAVEAVNDLPPPFDFHDFHALTCLLYGHDPFQWEPAEGLDQTALISMALTEKIIPLDSYGQFLGNAAQEHLAAVYEEIELPVIAPTLAMTLTGVPFNTSALEELAGREGSVATNATALLRQVQPDGRIYADLDPLRTVTGRYSCREPNLQGLSPALRAAVEASPGHLLLEADVSQCELRVVAHFSQDPRLLAAYRDGNADLHVQTAAAALGIAPEQVTDEQRGIGKQVNFAIVYGMTADSLAQKLAISPIEGQALLDGYFAAYPGVRAWIARVHAAAYEDRQVRTFSGRRRQIPDIRSRDPGEVATAQPGGQYHSSRHRRRPDEAGVDSAQRRAARWGQDALARP